MNLTGLLLFCVLILAPYGMEQVTYFRLARDRAAAARRKTARVIRAYTLPYLWDAAHFTVLVAAGIRCIGSSRPWSLWDASGFGVFLLGVGLRIWALRELGSSYDSRVAIQNDHHVVTTGPYRLMRHPLHLGTTLQIFGLALFGPVWIALPAMVVSAWLTFYLDRSEDQILLEHIGSDYAAYYERTWDIIDLFVRKGELPHKHG